MPPFLVFVVLIAATIPWRSKTFYEGGLDAVVVAKAFLSIVALAVAFGLSLGARPRPVPAIPILLVAGYLTATVLGGWADGSLVPSLVVATRVAILGATVAFLARRYDGVRLIGALVAALAIYGLLGAVTGIGTLAEGRLSGGFPPLHPNELASIAAVVIVWSLWRLTNAQDGPVDLIAVAIATPVILATGSRTPLFALVVSVAVLMIQTTALRRRTIAIGIIAVPIVLWIVAATPVLQDVIFRGQGQEQFSTLSNRTIAWRSALAPKESPWLDWFGGGLAKKQIEVPGQWWNTQILDSSWISALVQGGLVGAALCLLLIVYGLFRSMQTPVPLRALQLALITYLAVRGVLESGLFDGSPAFLMLSTIILSMPRASTRTV